jgi:hypothetical protein
MGARKRRAADRAGRPAMRSPGRPPVGRREHRQRFWVAIARGPPAKMPAWRPACPRPWGHAGSVKAVACQPSAAPRCQGATCRSPSEKKSPSSAPKTSACARPPGGWDGPPRPSPGNGAATPRPVAAGWSIGPRPPSGTPTSEPSAPRSPRVAANQRLRSYLQERRAGEITRPNGIAVSGPEVRWIGRRHGRHQDRRWGTLVVSGADREPAGGRLTR